MEKGFPYSIRQLRVPGNAFWLSNVLASFQGYINKILAKKLNIFLIIYLDDIFIYIKDPSQGHVDAI